MSEGNVPMAHNLADIISTIPLSLGRAPEESVVVILVLNSAVRAYMMHSLPTGGMQVEHIMELCKSLTQIEFDEFMTVAYTDVEPSCAKHPGYFHESVAFSVAVERLVGAQCIGGAVVTKDYWVNYREVVDAGEEGEYPRRPLTELQDAPIALEIAVNYGSRIRPGAHIPEGNESEHMKALIRQFYKGLDKPRSWEQMMDSPDTSKAQELWERCLARDFGPMDAEAAELIAHFLNVNRRDRLIVDVLSKTTDKSIALSILTGNADVPVQQARHESAVALLTNLLQYAEGKRRVNLLIGLAFLSWLRGDSFHAGEYLEAVPEKYRNEENDWVQLNMVISHGGLAKSAARPPMP